MEMETKQIIGLCNRCERRAIYLEDGYAPRSECKSSGAVAACYAFENMRPLALKRREGDDRPQFAGALLSARSYGVKNEEDFVMDIVEHADGSRTAFWRPKAELESIKESLMKEKKKPASKPVKKKEY